MPELLVVRHAIAMDRLASMERGLSDAERPLTDEGRVKMQLAVQGLQRIQSGIDVILTSPLLRAQQTAAILEDYFPLASSTKLKTLAPPYNSEKLIPSLSNIPGKRIAIVGHEPGLSMLIASLICGADDGAIELKKGGMAQLHFAQQIAPGEGTLQWLLRPKQLRLLGNNN